MTQEIKEIGRKGENSMKTKWWSTSENLGIEVGESVAGVGRELAGERERRGRFGCDYSSFSIDL